MSEMEKRRYFDGLWLGLGIGIAIGFSLAMIGAAQAQGYVGPPPLSWCYDQGYFPARKDGSCWAEDRTKFAPLSAPTGTIATTTITNHTLRCPADRTMVTDGTRVRCAKDLIDAE